MKIFMKETGSDEGLPKWVICNENDPAAVEVSDWLVDRLKVPSALSSKNQPTGDVS